ncbi:MAG: diguanylate cyclase domain-containing protein [Hylemonella sp.]
MNLQALRPTGRLLAGAVALYVLAAWVSLALSGLPGQVATSWFANPVGTVTLLQLAPRLWPAALAALGLANLLANAGAAAVAGQDATALWLASTAFVPANLLEMTLAAALLRQLGTDADTLRQPRRLGWVLLAGALVPALCGATLGTALLAAPAWPSSSAWVAWFAGSLTGAVAALPLALSLALDGWRPLLASLRHPRSIGLLLLVAAITLLAVTTLPHPFVVIAIGLVHLAVRAPLALTALATLGTAALLDWLRGAGVLLMPPGAHAWSPLLFHASVLAGLLPGLFLAAAVEGQQQTMQALRASEQRFRSLYTRTPAMLHSIDIQGRLLSVSEQWLTTLGYAEHEVLGRPFTDFLTPESARHAREHVIPLALRQGRCDAVSYQMVARDGRVLDVLLSAIWIYDEQGQPLHSLAVVEDVTEKRQLQARSHYAEHDPLTGLPNRVLLQDRLERSCLLHQRHGSRFAVGFLDLDRFKDINDRHGHDAGDALLRQVAARLQAALRATDTVSRLAGDEFVLLFADVEQAADLQALARKILAQLAQPYRLGDGADAPVVEITASIGLAVFPEHGRDPSTLLAHADQAMYAAKHAGRNQVVLYSPG